MIDKYINLADECILITAWKDKHKKMLLTLVILKNFLEEKRCKNV